MPDINHRLRLWMRAAAAITILSATAPLGQAAINALWAYSVRSLPNVVTDASARDTLIQNSSASGVNMLYASVYSSTPNIAGRFMYDDSAVAALITKAHAKGIQVYAALGDPDWPSLGCATSANPYKRFADIAGYDSANPSARFDGIILDVEPGSNPDFAALLGLYQCFKQRAQSSGLELAAAINAFWNAPVAFNQVTEEAYKQIVDLKLNHVVVMGYRNFAGTLDCSQGDGLVCLDEKVIEYASSVSLAYTILVGLNTDSGALAKETFYSLGQAAMNSAALSVYTTFAAAGASFGGFAIHNYRDSYLNGPLSGWPATNPAFPAPGPQFSAAGVINSASFLGGGVAPGELVSIFGQNLGPGTPQLAQVGNGTVTNNLGGVQVLFNGIPSPLMLAYSGQVNAIVPFEVQANSTAVVQVIYSGAASVPVTVPVVTAAPGIFTLDSSGNGLAVVVNQDYSLNGPTNPAAAGSAVYVYLTGAGETDPPGVDGLVSSDAATLAHPVALVTAQIGGLPATVLYAGNAVGIVSGALQVNLLVPAGLAPGPQPVVVRVGANDSQSGVVVAVR